jgi:hypothetical protein
VPEALLQGLSIKPKRILKNNQAYFAIYSNEDDVLSVVQDSEQLKTLAPYDVHIPANPDTGTGLIRTPVFLAFL